ncbi:acarviose transferase (ATase) [Actinoplanes sp. SE50]|uniref:alpha-amylase family glycosyl hydrolase n=1 Tax=unclassified Actinoplanes TaxID=2626549 RepID=UPI00006CA2D9|nr:MULTISPECIES: alpha-amylase family glycosyl hydrolase [unclassified Actinoplanes]AEV84579.1 acarviose transferase (ATase) [Actinoplanes sp. SE50/110]ATO82971.1 acarviose transferase (ATase) [Actinoplanes sp. SE50]CAJ81031.1 acarviose transferase (ATase) AcbD [Actinoplanes sp. SE50/110]SLM00379.1 acarviose transferase [Actinoplanes sp. SE50/110]
MQRHARHAIAAAVAVSLLPPSLPAHAAGASAVVPYAGNPASLKQDLCYQIATDRFSDGNPANNNPGNVPGMFADKTKLNDRQEWLKYMGGDFAGITQRMEYLKNLGVGAIWISPHVDNINVPANGATGYHGYWPRDFKRLEEHFGTDEEFDALVSAAHASNIKVIMDWTPNGTNPPNQAEDGALYDDGQLVGRYGADSAGHFHHGPAIGDFNDRYQDQYYSLADIADLDQQNPRVDQLLKDDANYWMDRGVDGIRVDAVKHMPLSWQRSFADAVTSHKSAAIFGEWYMGDQSDPLYADQVKFANTSGIAAMDFYTNRSIRDTFAGAGSMKSLDAAITKTNRDYLYEQDLITFLDNQDTRRFGTLNSDPAALHRALAFLLTTRGTPCLFYGTEQYLHNDTGEGSNKGKDPYNRPPMASFDTDTVAYREIRALSDLRRSNPAVAYGDHQQRWINDDVYVYERRFGDNVLLTAINKGSHEYRLDGLRTALPAGTYRDVLGGTFGGSDLTVEDGDGTDRSTVAPVLGAGQVAVWSYRAPVDTEPRIGGVGPVVTRAGATVTVEGTGFGSGGTVAIGGVPATVQQWTADRITATVPVGVPTGAVQVTVGNGSGTSNGYPITTRTGKPVPVQFTVQNPPATAPGESLYLTGDVAELGHWSTSPDQTAGQLLRVPNESRGVLVADLPAGAPVEFKFVKVAADGTVTWEGGANHRYTVPAGGTGTTTLTWQR